MNRRTIILIGALALAAAAAYAGWPRAADLRAFDPAAMARLETAMWRDYYESAILRCSMTSTIYRDRSSAFHRWIAFVSPCRPRGPRGRFSRPGRAREADEALPDLVTYYGLLRPAAPAGFDVREAARLELDWWQARREAVGPQSYGLTVAAVAALTYGKRFDDPALRQSGIERAEAMAFRDARGRVMGEQDWTAIETRLLHAYRLLKAAVAEP